MATKIGISYQQDNKEAEIYNGQKVEVDDIE